MFEPQNNKGVTEAWETLSAKQVQAVLPADGPNLHP